MIIIPDIHGRTFWKEAVTQASENEKIIFLGDYLDAYPWEKYSNEDVVHNFEEIIEFKKNNKDRCILLLGNHDCEYFIHTTACRCMYSFASKISSLFIKNIDLFDLVYVENICDKIYTFSHAPIIKPWVNGVALNFKIFNINDDIFFIGNQINNILHSNYSSLKSPLDMIGFQRGGYSDTPSPIWCDIREISTKEQFPNTYEIFGHTQLISEIITDTWACLDCRRAFRLNEQTREISPVTPEIKI